MRIFSVSAFSALINRSILGSRSTALCLSTFYACMILLSLQQRHHSTGGLLSTVAVMCQSGARHSLETLPGSLLDGTRLVVTLRRGAATRHQLLDNGVHRAVLREHLRVQRAVGEAHLLEFGKDHRINALRPFCDHLPLARLALVVVYRLRRDGDDRCRLARKRPRRLLQRDAITNLREQR